MGAHANNSNQRADACAGALLSVARTHLAGGDTFASAVVQLTTGAAVPRWVAEAAVRYASDPLCDRRTCRVRRAQLAGLCLVEAAHGRMVL